MINTTEATIEVTTEAVVNKEKEAAKQPLFSVLAYCLSYGYIILRVVFVDINLSRVFLTVFLSLAAVFALLCFLKGRFKYGGFALAGDILRYLCLQGLISLTFLLSYVLFIKNGVTPALSDIGVAFIPLTVGVYWAAWGLGVLSPSPWRLCLPLAYSLFLLWRFFTAGKGIAFFGYIIFNPSFGFIGSQLSDSTLKPLAALGALLPFCCAAIGRSLGVKTIDKKRKI